MSQALRLVMGNTDLKMDREKRQHQRVRSGQKDGEKCQVTWVGSPKLKKKRISWSKSPHKKIKIGTENNSLDNVPRRSLLTLPRAVGKKWWWQKLYHSLSNDCTKGFHSTDNYFTQLVTGQELQRNVGSGKRLNFCFELRTFHHIYTMIRANLKIWRERWYMLVWSP